MPMAPRAARRSAPVLVLLVVGLLSVTALVAAGLLLPIPRPDLCATLVTVALDGVARGCGDVARASAALAAAGFAACAPTSWSNPTRLWNTCVTGSRDTYGFYFEASREEVPRWVFRILVEEGRRDRALAFARERGWLREDVEYCGHHALPIDDETSALLAILTQPERADCALPAAVRVADAGAAPLGRMMLLHRIPP